MQETQRGVKFYSLNAKREYNRFNVFVLLATATGSEISRFANVWSQIKQIEVVSRQRDTTLSRWKIE